MREKTNSVVNLDIFCLSVLLEVTAKGWLIYRLIYNSLALSLQEVVKTNITKILPFWGSEPSPQK